MNFGLLSAIKTLNKYAIKKTILLNSSIVSKIDLACGFRSGIVLIEKVIIETTIKAWKNKAK